MTTKSTVIETRVKPILLNGKGRLKSLDMMLGGLRLQLWDFTQAEGKPHVRLILDSRNDLADMSAGEQDEELTRSSIDLDAMQASALAIAIDRWVQSFESNMPESSVSSMSLRIGGLSLVFSGSGRKRSGRVRLTLAVEGNGPATTKLTRVETNVLGTLLGSFIGEEPVEES